MHMGNKIIGVTDKRLQLLSEESGVFRPCVLTALVGSSSVGRTTHLDVLAGRKTGGCIEGDIKISGRLSRAWASRAGGPRLRRS
jgi:predicted ABC-type transport system involved in lysophospholipase L1 biosynthesis ATPase subunit